MALKYQRILLKISGEALGGEKGMGFDEPTMDAICGGVKKAHDLGVQIGIVVGGGNFWRGRSSGKMERTLADKIGMLATVMNALAVSDKLEQLGVPTEVFTSITMPQVAQPFTRKDALRAMDKGKIAVFGGGTGNPFFSTDTATALRAVEVSADVMFKATMVDGVYDKDPHKYADAKKYDTIQVTNHAGHARELANAAAQQARQSGEELRVFTAGGDGTFNEALTGIYGYANAAVGCLPFGSGNDFLRTFGTKEEFLDLDAQLAGGPVSIDLMQTSLGLSATICAAGLDAQVAYGIPKFRRIPLCGGEMAYVLSIVEQLCGHIGRRVEYTIDGETLDVDCLMCAICNGRTYGGGFCAAPEAQPDDGWLDVYIIRKVSRVTIAKLLGMYKSGKHFQNGQLVRAAEPYFIYRRAKQVSLRAADGRGPIVATADGECAPKEQITVQVQPLAGRILLPKPAFERFAAQRTAQSADRT